jgi:uncharacterized membrane protein
MTGWYRADNSDQRMGLSDRTVRAALIGIVLFGAGLRIYNLDSSLWYDEIKAIVDFIRPPLGAILTNSLGASDHIFSYALAHLSFSIFGEQAWSLRLPFALFGIATIPMLYFFGARITSRFEALAATCLLAFSYHHIWFSQNARAYVMLLFWTLLSSHLILKALKEGRLSTYVGYAVAAAFGIYTHLIMVFIILTHGAIAVGYLLKARATDAGARQWRNPALGFGLFGLLMLVLYGVILVNGQIWFEHMPIPSEKRVSTPLWAIEAALKGLNVGFTMLWVVALAGIVGLVGCWSYLRQSVAVCTLFILPVVIVLGATLCFQRPVFPRFLFFSAGFVLLIGTRGIVVVSQWIADRLQAFAFAQTLGVVLPCVMVAGGLGCPYSPFPIYMANPSRATMALWPMSKACASQTKPWSWREAARPCPISATTKNPGSGSILLNG